MATSDHLDRPADGDDQRETNAGCPECGGSIRSNTGKTVCESCGLVLEEQRIDSGPEWRTFGDTEENVERTGTTLTPSRHDRGLSTVIGHGPDANGNTLSGRKRRRLGRLRREQSRGRWRSKAERNLARGRSETRRVASALDLPRSIQDQACQLFRSAAREKLLLGRSRVLDALDDDEVSLTRVVSVPRPHGADAGEQSLEQDLIQHPESVDYVVLMDAHGRRSIRRKIQDETPRHGGFLRPSCSTSSTTTT